MITTGFQQDDQQTIDYFTDLVARNGIDPRSLDWGSRDSQALRFAVLAGVAPLDNTSVLDVGCGLGDFREWMNDQGIEAEYAGVDITPTMIETARQRFPGERFDVANLLAREEDAEEFDIVVASGIFYRRQVEAESFMQQMIAAMFRRCRRAVAFNSLSAWAPEQEPGEFYADPVATLDFCRSLTPWVSLRHDYHQRDFTIYLYRERQLS